MRDESGEQSSGMASHARLQAGSLPDLICLSHLRWNFVLQRPQHLMLRWGRERRVFFIEEPLFHGAGSAAGARDEYLAISEPISGVRVVTPHLPAGLSAEEQ